MKLGELTVETAKEHPNVWARSQFHQLLLNETTFSHNTVNECTADIVIEIDDENLHDEWKTVVLSTLEKVVNDLRCMYHAYTELLGSSRLAERVILAEVRQLELQFHA